MNKLKRFGAWLNDHADLLVVVVLILLLREAYDQVQLIDARIGFDGWSDILYGLLSLLMGIAAMYVGWGIKVRLHGETTDDEDQWLRKTMREHVGPVWTNSAFWSMLIEMAINAFWALLPVWIVFRAANPAS